MSVAILIALMALLVALIGLPLLTGHDSIMPELISFVILGAVVLYVTWTNEVWWILFPILTLVALTFWLDRGGNKRPQVVEPRTGMSRRTRLRFHLWRTAKLAILASIAALFLLPAASLGGIVVPCLMIAMVAMSLFRFSFYRSWRRDLRPAPDGPFPGVAAPLG